MPSSLATADLRDHEALTEVALIEILVAGARDHYPYSRADDICGRSCFVAPGWLNELCYAQVRPSLK